MTTTGPSRRAWLQHAAGLLTAPALITADSQRPAAISGVQVGDVVPGRAVLWSRTDRPARMLVEYATTERFANARRLTGPVALAARDFTARLDLTGLPAGQEIFYRVHFEDLSDGKTRSAPLTGRFRTAPRGRRNVRLVWSGDTAGQGWGINPEWGGMRLYESMRRRDPDVFVHSGDTIYADSPIQAEVKLPDGGVWRNLVTEEKSKVAETLHEFRGNYRYNLLDEHVRRFNQQVAQIWQWDDHEVSNNWSPGKEFTGDPRYREREIATLVSRATQAFQEYAPLRPSRDEASRVYRMIPYGPLLDVFVLDMRSYRGPNTHNRQERESVETAYLGRPQLEWLRKALRASRATWKVIASDMPLGLLVGDGKDAAGQPRFENSANGDGPALGRELEIASLLRGLKADGVRDTVWITADTHYTAAHHYAPERARFAEFDPFWEFVSGPIHSGTFGPNPLDNTFGPQVVFQKAPPPGQANLPPSAGMQFFGEIEIDGKSGALTVTLRDLAGTALFTKALSHG